VDLPAVNPPDADARRVAAALAAPYGTLGELGCWLAAAQGICPPRPPERPRLVVFAGDHGIAEAGVSAHPAGTTAKLVGAVREQAAPVAVVAATSGATIRVVDVALDHEPEDGRYHVRRGSGRIDREDALTAEETERAFAVGRTLADDEVDAGADLLVPVSLGVGATTPASTLVAALTITEPVAVIGRGSGIDDTAWMRKAAAVRDGLRRTRRVGRDPEALLRVAGGADLAALVGFLAQAARRRTPVLLDGAAVCVAALLADAWAPGSRAWWQAATRDTEPAQALALEVLGLDPLLLLDLRAGAATGALAAVPLVTMAARVAAGS
jgi:nicotinate-nucleotide--dimethylbenzimidazole phosphoribosyltransferase